MKHKTQNRVLVLDKNKEPLMPAHPARARELLNKGRAAVYRRYPFTLILKEREGGVLQETQLKMDPGAKTTGLALVTQSKRGKRCVWAAELLHRGATIKKALEQRRNVRRSRRNRKTRYRKPRFNNRRRRAGWLPPSLQSRVDNLLSWTKRLRSLVPLTGLSMELVRFDTQKLQHPELTGVEYQQGELLGYEVREYLLEKFHRTCVYCGKKEVPLQVEHIVPKSRGGSDRVSNLTLACAPCNRKKGNKTAQEFGFPKVQEQAKKPLRDAAMMNATRFALMNTLKELGLALETGTGGSTKYNRSKQGYPKTHWLDAVCVGESGAKVYADEGMRALQLKAMGRGTRQMCRVDKYGFPRTKAKKEKRVKGFQTGDMVKAVVPKGKKKGSYQGRVAVRASGSFNVKTEKRTIQGISSKHCKLLQQADGYSYS